MLWGLVHRSSSLEAIRGLLTTGNEERAPKFARVPGPDGAGRPVRRLG